MPIEEPEQRLPDHPKIDHHLQKKPSTSTWATIGGDCPLLRDYLASKKGTTWKICGVLVSLLRGFSQTTFSNNPITGIIIIITLALTSPGPLIVCSATGLLGHFVSMIICEPDENIINGLAVFNPLIYGLVSYNFVPIVYGGFDDFSLAMIVLGVFFIAYLWRACGNTALPCLTMPFNLAEIILLITLKNACGHTNNCFSNRPMTLKQNTTATEIIASLENVDHVYNDTTLLIDEHYWSMIVRATVASASQLFVLDNIPLGAIIYLGVLIYSPITCMFGFLGSLGSSLVAIQVGAPYASISSGLWGYNGYLTGASLGGSFLVINRQVAAATCVAIILTGFMQHVLQIIFSSSGLPVGTIPFVLTTWLFVGLGKNPDEVFRYPHTVSYPEAQRSECLSIRRNKHLERVCHSSQPNVNITDGKTSLV